MIETGGDKQSSVEEGCGGRTILVGVKLDAPSRELLTWALVKVAEPGDTVIALHILGNGYISELFLNIISLTKKL
jgi:hypothetical protein